MPGRGTWRVGRLAGIPIGIHPLWLAIVGLLTWSLGDAYFPDRDAGLGSLAAYGLGLLSALLLFAGLLAHELGHAIVARRHGVQVEEIDLWLLGGVARLSGDVERPEDELRFALAGPAVTAVIIAVAGAARLATGDAVAPWVSAVLDYQVTISALILAFNMLPAFPLDGGRVLRALLWRRSADRAQATRRAAAIGHGFGIAIAAFGFLGMLAGAVGGLWFMLIGGFLIVAGRAELQGQQTRAALAGLTVADLMSAPPDTVSADLTLQEAVVSRLVAHLHGGYPVVDRDGIARGVLTLRAIRAIPATQRDERFVLQVADCDPTLLVSPELPVYELLERPAFGRARRAVAVGPGGEPVGIISMSDLMRAGTVHDLLASEPRPPLLHA